MVLTGGLGFLGKLLPGGFMPSEDMGYLMVNIQLPDAASMQRADVVTSKVEKIIKKHEEVEYITAVAGFSLLAGARASGGMLRRAGRRADQGRSEEPGVVQAGCVRRRRLRDPDYVR